jgi:hypothetical protein
MASKFTSEFDFKPPMYVDMMQNTFNEKFHIWPDKSIVIRGKGPMVEIVFTALLNDDASRSTNKWADDIIKFIDSEELKTH